MAVVFGRGCGNDLVGGEFFVGGVSHGDQTCDRDSMDQKLAWKGKGTGHDKIENAM